MNYVIEKNKIIIKSNEDFNVLQTLNCGQLFRFEQLSEGEFVLISTNQKCVIKILKNEIVILGEPEYWQKYFDLDLNYSEIKNTLIKYENLKKAIEFGGGIRIVKQDIFESMISFIISANNNIPRIKKTIESLCVKYGEKIHDYYAFPTIESLIDAKEEFYKSIGAGYRSSYLCKAVKYVFENKWLIDESSRQINTHELKKELLKICGIGNKVADCVLLFGYGKTDVFPTDTWVAKAMQGGKENAKKISVDNALHYGCLAGYAQQYLFYYERSGKNKLIQLSRDKQ